MTDAPGAVRVMRTLARIVTTLAGSKASSVCTCWTIVQSALATATFGFVVP